MIVHYVPPPTEFAVLVVHRDARTRSTPQADHLLQSNTERRRYPEPWQRAQQRVQAYVD